MVPLPRLQPAVNPARALAGSPSGELWVSLYGGGILRYHHGNFQTFDKSHGVVGSNLLPEADGSILFSSSSKLWRLQSGASSYKPLPEGPLPPTPEQEPAKSVSALLRATNDDLWIGRGSLLQRIRDGRHRNWTQSDGMPPGRIIALLEATDGNLWIGTTTGLAHLDPEGSIRSWLSEEGFAPGSVRALFEDEKHQIWAGTYGGGLARIAPDGRVALLDRSHGLAEDIVSRIVGENRGRLVLQGNHTLSVVSLAELNAVANGDGQ